jgi:hypothetical protein
MRGARNIVEGTELCHHASNLRTEQTQKSVGPLRPSPDEDARSNDALGKLTRHETTLMNAFTKTLQTLLLLQEKRGDGKAEPVTLEGVALSPAA